MPWTPLEPWREGYVEPSLYSGGNTENLLLALPIDVVVSARDYDEPKLLGRKVACAANWIRM